MITVSTTSPAEGRRVAEALAAGLPHDMAYSVYVNGTLLSERGGLAVHPADAGDQWPPPEPEVRGG